MLDVYLTESPVAVLQKEFVEIEEPLCTDIDFHTMDHLKTTLILTASNVPVEELEEFPVHFFELLRRIVDEEDIDMQRMSTVIEKEMLKVMQSIRVYRQFCTLTSH